MKKISSVLLAAVFFCSVFFFSGCGLFDAFAEKVPTTYSGSEKYTAGNTEFEGKVDTFSIWWLYGSVTIKTHKENTVKIEESANKELENTFRLHWRYYEASEYGKILYIYYSASGKHDYGDLKKDITVYLPENDDMNVSVTSQTAAVDIDFSGYENTLESLSVVNYSGKVAVKLDNADEVRISGQNNDDVAEADRIFFFRADGYVNDLGISSSYAKVDAAVKTVRYADVGTVFSDLCFAADEAKKLSLCNSGGKISARVLAFDSIDIETRDMPCELALASDAGFTLTMKEKNRFNQKVSPKNVAVEFEGATQSGGKYTVGTGAKTITVATDSELRIIPFEEAS